MNTKLTLSIDAAVVAKGKEFAKMRGISLSRLLENYLKAITTEEGYILMDSASASYGLRGSFKAPDDLDYKKNLKKKLKDKYL